MLLGVNERVDASCMSCRNWLKFAQSLQR